jgi:hypothetical protein
VRISAWALAVLSLAALGAGCGAGEGGERARTLPAAGPGSIAQVLARPGPDLPLTPGTSDYAPGEIRLSFLIIDRAGRSIERPQARVWVARSATAPVLARSLARLEPVGVPGVSAPAAGEVTKIYVTRFRVSAPGRYLVAAEPVGGRRVQGALEISVKRRTAAPAVGERAPLSQTPTLATSGGDTRRLTTADPPDRELLRYSVADSIRAHVPFVVTFATPRFCTSRTCGPVVDVVEAVRRRFVGRGVRFIHVEIYEGNDPARGPNRFVRQWRLPSEPFTFLVGSDGRVAARFEGSVSVRELSSAVERYLLRR